MHTHLYLEPLDYIESPRPSFGLRSAYPADTVIFFVHGFGGSALATWREFDSLVTTDAAFRNCDLVFLGYDSIRKQTRASAGRLYESCKRVLRDAAEFTRVEIGHQTLKRSPDLRYRNIVFVAHSLGAIVTRLLLLMAEKDDQDWLPRVRMILFAPAHAGATDVVELATAVPNLFGKAGGIAKAVVRWKAQTLREVKQGSTTLDFLMKRTTGSLESREAAGLSLSHLVAKHVCFGEKEDVVDMTPFCRDPEVPPIPGHDHTSICKPTTKYLTPLQLLQED
jgi:pimeloyl-ACP methyl ester carboxylesterase